MRSRSYMSLPPEDRPTAIVVYYSVIAVLDSMILAAGVKVPEIEHRDLR